MAKKPNDKLIVNWNVKKHFSFELEKPIHSKCHLSQDSSANFVFLFQAKKNHKNEKSTKKIIKLHKLFTEFTVACGMGE